MEKLAGKPVDPDPWKVGDKLMFWAGKARGWVEAEILSVSMRGVPTVRDPGTGKRRTLHDTNMRR